MSICPICGAIIATSAHHCPGPRIVPPRPPGKSGKPRTPPDGREEAR